jgi:hypothetical protein
MGSLNELIEFLVVHAVKHAVLIHQVLSHLLALLYALPFEFWREDMLLPFGFALCIAGTQRVVFTL